MEGYKYPYIPNKRMYAAVMGACKWIRQSGYFNKAVSYYADKYNVDADELAKHIRARQGAGQKGKKRGTYKYYVVLTWESCDADGVAHLYGIDIKKALTPSNAKGSWFNYNRSQDYGGSYALFRFDEVYREYQTKKEADEKCHALKDKINRLFGYKTVYADEFQRLVEEEHT